METRTTIRLGEELSRRAKRAAAQRKVTFTRLVQDALRAYLTPAKPLAHNERFDLPTFGDPSKALRWEDLQQQIEAMEMQDDLEKLGLKKRSPDAAA